MSLTWSPQALIDLEAIRAHIAEENSPQVADRFIDHLIAQAIRLESVPGVGKRVQSPAFSDVRRWPVRPYWLYYRKRAVDVEILRIWHYRRSEPPR